MKIFSRFVFALFAIFLMSFGSAVYGDYIPGVEVGHPWPGETSLPNYGEENPFFKDYGGQCTSFCWGRAVEKFGLFGQFGQFGQLGKDDLPKGKAQDWLKEAEEKGFQTGLEAQPNSIAVWSKTVNGIVVGGHVAFVEEVKGEQVFFNEANFVTFNNTKWGGGYDGYQGSPGAKALSKDQMKKRTIYISGKTVLSGYIYLLPMVIPGAAVPPAPTQLPNFSATPCGTTDNLTLTADINISDADVGKTGNTYLAFNFQQNWLFNNGIEWVNKGTGWEFGNGASPIYSSGPLANQIITVVKNANVSSLSGGQLYVGYGLTEIDMTTNKKYGLVYPVPTTLQAITCPLLP